MANNSDIITDNILYQLWQNKKFPHSLIIDCANLDFALQQVEIFLQQILPPSISLANNPDYQLIKREPNSTGNIAKNITISQIRQAEIYLFKTAAISQCKVLVIYEADLLNINSANAALKILEEPPQDCYLILLTNNISNIISTIKSRCYKLKLAIDKAESEDDYQEMQERVTTLLRAHNIDDIYKFAAEVALKKNQELWHNFAIYIQHYLVANTLKLSMSEQIRLYENISNIINDTEIMDLDKRLAVILVFHKIIKLRQ